MLASLYGTHVGPRHPPAVARGGTPARDRRGGDRDTRFATRRTDRPRRRANAEPGAAFSCGRAPPVAAGLLAREAGRAVDRRDAATGPCRMSGGRAGHEPLPGHELSAEADVPRAGGPAGGATDRGRVERRRV